MGVVGKGFQKGKPEEGEALLMVVPFVKEAAIMQRIIGGAVYCIVSSERVPAVRARTGQYALFAPRSGALALKPNNPNSRLLLFERRSFYLVSLLF